MPSSISITFVVKSHADPPFLPPNHMAGPPDPISLDHQDEPMRNADRTLHFQCCARSRNVADGAVDHGAVEQYLPGF